MKAWRSRFLCLTVLILSLLTTSPAFAHEDDEGVPAVDKRITQTSTALATGALVLVVGGGIYIFLVKRGIIKSKSVDRWE